MKHHDPNDKTATHFIARKNKTTGGFFITLYRFKNTDYGIKTGKRPQYKGPLGWQFHSQQNDTDVIKEMHTIDKLPAITGDDLTKGIFNQNSMYAG